MNRFHVHLNVADLPASVRFHAERATDGAACTPDVHAMTPKVDTGAPCCAPQSGCC